MRYLGLRREGEERQEQWMASAAIPVGCCIPSRQQHWSGSCHNPAHKQVLWNMWSLQGPEGSLWRAVWGDEKCWLESSEAEGEIWWGFGIKVTPVSSFCLSITWQWNVGADECKENSWQLCFAPLYWEGCTMYWPWLKKSNCFWGSFLRKAVCNSQEWNTVNFYHLVHFLYSSMGFTPSQNFSE